MNCVLRVQIYLFLTQSVTKSESDARNRTQIKILQNLIEEKNEYQMVFASHSDDLA